MTERWRKGACPGREETLWEQTLWEPDLNEMRQEVAALRSMDAQLQRDAQECRVSVGDLEALLRGELARIAGQFKDQERSLKCRFEQLRTSSIDQDDALRSAVAAARDELEMQIGDVEAQGRDQVDHVAKRICEANMELPSSKELRRLEAQQRADVSSLQEELRNLGERLSSQGSTLTATLSTMRSGVQSQDDRLQADHAQLRSQVNDLQGELTPQVHAFEDRLVSIDKALRDFMRDSEDHVTRSVDAMRAQVKDDAQHMTASFGEIESRHKSNHDMLGAAVQAIEKRIETMKGSVDEQLAGTKAKIVEDNQRISDNLQSITHTIDSRFQEERNTASELRSSAEAFAIQRGQDLEQRISAMKLNLEEQLSRTSSQNIRNTEGLNAAQALLRDFEQRMKVQMEQIDKTRQLLTDRQDSVDVRFREQVQVQVDTKSLVMSSVKNLEDKLVRQIRDIKRT